MDVVTVCFFDIPVESMHQASLVVEVLPSLSRATTLQLFPAA